MIVRTSLWLIGLLVLALLQLQVDAKDEDYSGDGGDNSGGAAANEGDIYEPDQLETEVEAEADRNHHQNSLEGDAEAVDAVSTTIRMPPVISTDAPLPSAAGASGDSNTAAEEMEDAPTQKQETRVERPANNSQEYYYDEMHEVEAEQQHHQQPQAEPQAPTAATTTVPEYVRKAKAERLPPTESAPSDYVEDDARTPQPHNEEEIIYHDEPAERQLLPEPAEAKPFKHSSVEYYYDDEGFESFERRGPPTTTKRITTVTVTSAPAIVNSPTTTTTTSTPTPTTTINTTTPTAATARGKDVDLAKPELLPADQLRNYIKDVYIRMPLAVIVDPSAASLAQAKRLYIDALQDKNINIKIVLITLNLSGK